MRPAQCCEGGYGTMLIMYKIEIINVVLENLSYIGINHAPNLDLVCLFILLTFIKSCA